MEEEFIVDAAVVLHGNAGTGWPRIRK